MISHFLTPFWVSSPHSHFDRHVFSAEIGLVKPHKEIFEYALKTNGFVAEETLFIDDSPQNIAGAKACGIEGYLFDGDVEKLRMYLEICI